MEKSLLFLLAYPFVAGLIPLAIKTFFYAEEKISRTLNNDYWENSYDFIIGKCLVNLNIDNQDN